MKITARQQALINLESDKYLMLSDGRMFVLPNRKKARLFFSKGTATTRWHYSAYYPAFRWNSKLYRGFLRFKSLIGWLEEVENIILPSGVSDFVRDYLPSAVDSALLMGSPGPTQKFIFQIWDNTRVVGYLKFAQKSAAQNRLQQEYQVLESIPKGIGPSVLKFGELEDGLVLLLRPVSGDVLPAYLSSVKKLKGFFSCLEIREASYSGFHPWLKQMLEQHKDVVEPWVEVLTKDTWPITRQHGDCAPWNMYCDENGNITGIDWEYGTLEGFPHIDNTYFLLQVTMLMKKWNPVRAKDFAVRSLIKRLPKIQAQAIVNLTAFDAHHKALVDGHQPDDPQQCWRQRLWEAK